jgi:hypothetical protein
MSHLVCHETIPGSGYTRGQNITDQAEITAILANADLRKVFSQVPDGTFPDATASKSTPVTTLPPPSSSKVTTNP